MCGHYLVEPVACTPASGWEKGQVENQVGLVRVGNIIDSSNTVWVSLQAIPATAESGNTR
jgi:hypothetical protein